MWAGRSNPIVVFGRADIFWIPLGLWLVAFSTAGLIMASTTRDQLADQYVASVVFLVIGLYYLIGRFLVKRRLKHRTAYAISNRRAFVLIGQRDLRDAELNGGSQVATLSRDGQHMSVTFNAMPASIWSMTGRRATPNAGLDPFDFTRRFPVAFYDVADVDGLRAAPARVSAPPVTKS